jgi:hypothetical protein
LKPSIAVDREGDSRSEVEELPLLISCPKKRDILGLPLICSLVTSSALASWTE